MTARPNWPSLQGTIAGDVALPGSPTYERGFRAFNARFHDVRPQAVVLCATPEDVSETVAFLADHNVPFATRSGGHCFAGRSSTRGVLVDVTPMHAVSISAGTATVGAGARLGRVYDALGEHGLTIPGGTCPEVGIAGLALGGGLGILGRTYGVTSDRLIQAQIVLADGRIIDCDEQRHPELFWALRGAGAGNFGVVTSLTFATVPARNATNFHLAWPHQSAPAVIDAWQTWAPHAPDELAASLKVTVSGAAGERPSVDMYGAMAGTKSDASELLDGLVARARSDPAKASSQYLSHADTRRFWADLGAVEHTGATGPGPEAPTPYLFAKSEFFNRRVPRDAIAALVGQLAGTRAAGESRELDFMPWGGAYNRVRTDATAFAHREEQFLLKHTVVTDPTASPTETRQARRWLAGSWATVHPWSSGRAFQNFADPELHGSQAAYYGDNVQRLVGVKAHYDPTNSFRSHQSLPSPRSGRRRSDFVANRPD